MPAITPRCPDKRRELRAHATTVVYIYVCIVMTSIRVQIIRKVANHVHGQLDRGNFFSPRSRLKIWFRETGLVVPSRASLLILYTNAESSAYSRGSSQCPQRCPYIFTTIYHRVSHDFIGSRNYVPMAFTAASPLCPNTFTAVLLLYILWTRSLPPDLCLYKRKEFIVHGTISCVVFQNIAVVSTSVL